MTGDPRNGCGGEGGVPVRHSDSEADRYNYVDAFFSPYQKRFLRQKMREAHDAFVQHMANRQNYGNIMLMRSVRPDADTGADDVAYKSNWTKNTQAVLLERREQWAKLTDAKPDHHDLIWTYFTQLSKDAKKKLRCSVDPGIEPRLQAMIAKLFTLDAFKGDDSKAFWFNLCAWWVKYNGGRQYVDGYQKPGSEFKQLRETLLEWLVDKRDNKTEQERDGRMLKTFWCFMELAVERLRKKLPPGPDKEELNPLNRVPIKRALRGFMRRTKGDANKEIREAMVDTAWFGNRLLQDMLSIQGGDATWHETTQALKQALEAVQRVLKQQEQFYLFCHIFTLMFIKAAWLQIK